jgi:hypothetical protein
MNEYKHTDYLKMQILNEQNSELELTGNQTRLDEDMNRTRLEQKIFEIEKSVPSGNIAQVAHQIKQSNELDHA